MQGEQVQPKQQPGLMKMEAKGNWNGFLIFVWLAEHYHTPKANGLLWTSADDFKELFTQNWMNKEVEKNNCKQTYVALI